MNYRPAIAKWLPDYKLAWLAPDALAGAAVWAVLTPTAMAYAVLVGVDPIVGLYTVPVALLVYAVLGGSRLLVVGPDASVAVLSGAVVAAVAVGPETLGLAIVLALLVGLFYLLFSLFRLGWFSDLIPDPVLKGFIEGVVWVTILKQIDPLLGLGVESSAKRFVPKLVDVIQALPQAHVMTASVGLASILALFVIPKLLPRAPATLIVLVISIFLVGTLGLANQGVVVIGETDGSINWQILPTGISLIQIVDLLPGALAVLVIGSTLSIAAAKRAAEKTGERIDPDREFLALGAANIGAGLSGGYPVTGTLSKTAVAMQAGGKSQIGNLFTAVLAVLTILFLIPFFASLSDATLAAVVIVVMLEVSNIGYFTALWRVRRMECLIGLTAFAGVLAYGTLAGVGIGVVLALVLLADHIRRPPTAVIGRTTSGIFLPLDNPDAHEIPGMLIWRQYAPLVFLNARRLSNGLRARVEGRDDIRVVLLDGGATSGVDSTAGSAFRSVRKDLAARGIELWVANLRKESWDRIVTTLSNAGEPIPPLCDSLADAVNRFEKSNPNNNLSDKI